MAITVASRSPRLGAERGHTATYADGARYARLEAAIDRQNPLPFRLFFRLSRHTLLVLLTEGVEHVPANPVGTARNRGLSPSVAFSASLTGLVRNAANRGALASVSLCVHQTEGVDHAT